MEPWAVDGLLNGIDVVLFAIDGADGGVVDGTISALQQAGAEIVTQINLTPKFALESQPESDQLATIVGSVEQEPAGVRMDAADALGGGAASLALDGEGPTESGEGSAQIAYSELLRLLEEEDFISVVRSSEEGDVVPSGSSFVIAGGNADAPTVRGSGLRETTELGADGRRDGCRRYRVVLESMGHGHCRS